MIDYSITNKFLDQINFFLKNEHKIYSPNWFHDQFKNEQHQHIEDKPHIWFTRGLPRSGKSTVVNQLEFFDIPAVVINADEFRLAAYGPREYIHHSECLIGGVIWTTLRALLKRYHVIFDDTNSSEWSLTRLFEIDHDARYITITTPLEMCLDINRESKNIPEHVFYRINTQLKAINPEEVRYKVCGIRY